MQKEKRKLLLCSRSTVGIVHDNRNIKAENNIRRVIEMPNRCQNGSGILSIVEVI